MRTSSIVLALLIFVVGCKREEPVAPPAPTPSNDANPAEAKPAVPTTAPARATPEEQDLDPANDPKTRERAKALGAISVESMKRLKEGANVLVLVRGDKGGGGIYGSGPYTADSAIRRAVVHAGLLKDTQLGIVRVKFLDTKADHPSVPANGINPAAWGKYHLSYTIEAAE